MHETSQLSRRRFLHNTATLSAAAAVTPAGRYFAAGSDKVGIALVGCGERGTGAAMDCLESTPGVELVAVADLFSDKAEQALVKIREKYRDRVKVPAENVFLGFDAHQKVMALQEVAVVLLCTPPAFRPPFVQAAVEAGKHIFLEKPGGVDPVGIRSLMASAAVADQKKLSIVVGTQQRYQPQYQEILKRIHGGEMGEIVGGQAYWNWGFTDWHFQKRQPGWSDMEWQIRCWPYFTWLSGDHIVEQHLHNMDILNWALGGHPISCVGFGGRQARTSADYGNIYDHFVVEFEYPGGVRVMSMSSQIKGSAVRVGERVVGTKGVAWMTRQEGNIQGANPYKYAGRPPSGMVEEHAALIRSVREGRPINECKRLAESTLTVILGRMAAYTGLLLRWDYVLNNSQLDLMPKKLEFGPLPVDPVAIPGQTELV